MRASKRMQASLILHMKRRTVFRPRLAPDVEAGRRNVSMAQLLLHLGNVRSVRQRIGCRRRAHRMHTNLDGFGADAGFLRVFHDDVAIDGAGFRSRHQDNTVRLQALPFSRPNNAFLCRLLTTQTIAGRATLPEPTRPPPTPNTSSASQMDF